MTNYFPFKLITNYYLLILYILFIYLTTQVIRFTSLHHLLKSKDVDSCVRELFKVNLKKKFSLNIFFHDEKSKTVISKLDTKVSPLLFFWKEETRMRGCTMSVPKLEIMGGQ